MEHIIDYNGLILLNALWKHSLKNFHEAGIILDTYVI